MLATTQGYKSLALSVGFVAGTHVLMSIRLGFLGQEQPLRWCLSPRGAAASPLTPWPGLYVLCLPPVLQRNMQLPSLSIGIPLRCSFPFSFPSPFLPGPALTGHFPAVIQALCPLSVEQTSINGNLPLTRARFALKEDIWESISADVLTTARRHQAIFFKIIV